MTEDEVPITTKKKKEIKIRKQIKRDKLKGPARDAHKIRQVAPTRIERGQSEAVDIGARDAA